VRQVFSVTFVTMATFVAPAQVEKFVLKAKKERSSICLRNVQPKWKTETAGAFTA
jgi:hypothetical protein